MHKQEQLTYSGTNLYLAIEVSNNKWQLAFGDGKQNREHTIPARHTEALLVEIKRTKEKFGLSASAPVYSCYEAGRDGFWLHRFLVSQGVRNFVVDPASIELSRRQKRVKTDAVDARKLRQMLIRYWVLGEQKIWSVLHVPTEEQEEARRLHREEERLKKEYRQHVARIRSLLALHGVRVRSVKEDVDKLRDWKGEQLGEQTRGELKREQERLALVERQLEELRQARKAALKHPQSKAQRQAAQLAEVRGVGEGTAWDLAHEFFGWREFENRRQVGAAAGLTGCPYSSGESAVEQGISKAGNKRVRVWMIELGWRWLKWQPQSALSRWFFERFWFGGKRLRRIGIVALGRKLLIALWKYLQTGQLPEGAVLVKAR